MWKLGKLAAAAATAVVLNASSVAGARRNVFMYMLSPYLDWFDLCKDIMHMSDNGVTHILLSFFENGKGVYAAEYWAKMSQANQKECVAKAKAQGTTLLIAAGGEYGAHPWNTPYTTYAKKAVDWALANNMDGLDFDIEGFDRNFGDQPSQLNWLVDVSKEARRLFVEAGKPNAVITHAPQGPYFGSFGGSNRGYAQVMKQAGDAVDFYLVQYYNQGNCFYETYEQIFTKTAPGCFSVGDAYGEVKAYVNDDALMKKFVIGKPATRVDVYGSGFVEGPALKDLMCKAENELGYSGGVMAWSYRGVADTKLFLDNMGGEMCGTHAPPPPTSEPPAYVPPPTPTKAPVAPPPAAPTTTTTTKKPVAVPPPAPGAHACYHSEKGAWWEASCDSPKVCILASHSSESACVADTEYPHSTWATSDLACREANVGIACGSAPSGVVPAPGPVPGKKSCFVGEAWWVGDCNSSQLCVFDGSLTSEAMCRATSKPNAVWAASEAECRTAMQGVGCSA